MISYIYIYSGSTNDDRIVSSGDECDNDSEDSEKRLFHNQSDRMII